MNKDSNVNVASHNNINNEGKLSVENPTDKALSNRGGPGLKMKFKNRGNYDDDESMDESDHNIH